MEKINKKTPIAQLPKNYQIVLTYLRDGRDNAQKSSDLLKLTGIKEPRSFHLIVEELIKKHGYCIGTCRYGENRGYYFITSYFELMDTQSALESQADSMYRRSLALEENFFEEDEE